MGVASGSAVSVTEVGTKKRRGPLGFQDKKQVQTRFELALNQMHKP